MDAPNSRIESKASGGMCEIAALTTLKFTAQTRTATTRAASTRENLRDLRTIEKAARARNPRGSKRSGEGTYIIRFRMRELCSLVRAGGCRQMGPFARTGSNSFSGSTSSLL